MPSARPLPNLLLRILLWTGSVVLLLVLGAVLFIAIYGWNWARGPIERYAAQKTGRVLAIQGDLTLQPAWPAPRIRAQGVRFANPAWAKEPQMLAADAVSVTVDLPGLFRREVSLPEVHLEHPTVYLELGSEGRKSWLLDLDQKGEGARVAVGRLTLDQGMLGYDDAAARTRMKVQLSTLDKATTPSAKPTATPATPATSFAKPTQAQVQANAQAQSPSYGLAFQVQGLYKGLPLKASGNGGEVLALRDTSLAYPIKVDGTAGQTAIRAEGTITGLLQFSQVDMRLAVRGASLEQLYPLLGLALPPTRPFATEGHLSHGAQWWRYEQFTGRVGDSDIGGTLQVDVGGARPFLQGTLQSALLDIEDLGPLIGARSGSVQQAKDAAPAAAVAVATAGTPKHARVLPDIPFNSDRWASMDADVRLKAKTIRRAQELPLENLDTHLVMRDQVLTLDPLDLGLAGGQLRTVISLDGRSKPIQAHAQVRARKLQIAKLFPTVALNKASIGEVNGEFDLRGTGNSVGSMLASADGKVGLVVTDGEISRLMLEMIGLHLWEMLQLNLSGDRLVKLRCAVADFDVKGGTMHADGLVVDTAVTTIMGSGTIDLGDEKLDLRLDPRTKRTSPLALSSPIYIRGNFARPDASVDKVQVAARALGAVALAAINPLLALVPLVDPGPGEASDCRVLMREARALPRAARPARPAQTAQPPRSTQAATPPRTAASNAK